MTTESYQHMAPPAGPAGTVDHLDAGHGWTLVRLMTKQAFVREGAHMGHCLGDAMHYHLAGEEELTGDAIWSLRDRDGVSWATLEVLEGYNGDPAGARLSNVVMAKGPGNRTVRRSIARRLQPLVLAFRAAGRELDFSGETELVMADDGRVMREDQAPAEVREQSRKRHVARVIKLQGEARVPLRGMTPSEYITAILRREFVSLGVDSQAVFVGVGADIVSGEWPTVHIDATVSTTAPRTVDIQQDEVGTLRLLPYQQAIIDALAPAPRSDPTPFIDAVGAAMGLDRREVREVLEPPQERAFTLAARSLRGRLGGPTGCGGQYVLVPSPPIKDLLARRLGIGPLG